MFRPLRPQTARTRVHARLAGARSLTP